VDHHGGKRNQAGMRRREPKPQEGRTVTIQGPKSVSATGAKSELELAAAGAKLAGENATVSGTTMTKHQRRHGQDQRDESGGHPAVRGRASLLGRAGWCPRRSSFRPPWGRSSIGKNSEEESAIESVGALVLFQLALTLPRQTR